MEYIELAVVVVVVVVCAPFDPVRHDTMRESVILEYKQGRLALCSGQPLLLEFSMLFSLFTAH